MATLFQVTHRTHSHLGGVIAGRATGGSTTTIVDTDRLAAFDDDYFNRNGLGTAWVVYDAGAAAAAPEGEFSRVSDFVNSTQTVTLLDTLTAAVAAGDRYLLTNPRYPLDDIIDAVNSELDSWGRIEIVDTTSLDTASAQTEYTLPVVDIKLLKVDYELDPNDANDNRWLEIRGWTIQESATGSADLLVLPYQPPANRDMRLTYLGRHAHLWDNSDNLDSQIPLELFTLLVAKNLLERRLMEIGISNDPRIETQLTNIMNEIADQRQRFKRAYTVKKTRKLVTAPDYTYNPDEPATP